MQAIDTHELEQLRTENGLMRTTIDAQSKAIQQLNAENNVHRRLAEERAQEIARLEQALAEYRDQFGVWTR